MRQEDLKEQFPADYLESQLMPRPYRRRHPLIIDRVLHSLSVVHQRFRSSLTFDLSVLSQKFIDYQAIIRVNDQFTIYRTIRGLLPKLFYNLCILIIYNCGFFRTNENEVLVPFL